MNLNSLEIRRLNVESFFADVVVSFINLQCIKDFNAQTHFVAFRYLIYT